MPAWKKHEAGRRGRDAYESDDFYEATGRETAQERIERLTRTATALGHGYDPRSQGGRDDDDLTAVADELDRMLSERGGPAAGRPAATSRPHRASAGRTPPRQMTGMDDVLGALDRLDEQVQGLANATGAGDPGRSSSMRSQPQPGRYAVDALQEADHYSSPHRYPGEEDAEGFDDPYGYDPQPYRERTRVQRDASLHMYKDLGRRIDALRAPQEKALNQVREELGSLRDALGTITRGTSETVGRQNAELRRLADMVERLRADKRNDQSTREIRKEIADLKTMVGSTNVEGALQTLEHGYSHILQRLDELSRAAIDPRVLRGVTARLNEIEDAFAALPRSEHMTVLEDRVVNIAERMEELLERKGQAEMEPLRAELREVRGYVEQIDINGLVEGIDDRMKFVSGRLDDIEVLAREQRGLDSRLSAMEERMPEPETIARLQGRLEDIAGMMADDRSNPADMEHLTQVDRRLDDIVDRLERMEQAAPLPSADAGAFEALEKRLESISGKIDVIEKKASRPAPVIDAEAIKAVSGEDKKFLVQLQERLNDLSARLDEPKDTVTSADLDKLREEIGSMRASVAAPQSTDALEQRISDLAQLVSEGANVADDARFDQLGAKVAALAEQIESSSANTPGIEKVAPVLERIEQGLVQTRTDVTDIARKAAFDAVAQAPQPHFAQYDEAINALQGDLKRLLDAAEGGEQRTRNTFDSVKSVLGSLTERLDNLERVDIKTAQAAPVSAPAVEDASPAASISSVIVEDTSPAFTHQMQQTQEPLESPAAAADATTIQQDDRSRDRKADFIAAARRAAQAASVEAARLEQSQAESKSAENADEERGKARVGWLRNVLKRDKSAKKEDEKPEEQDDLELGVDDVAEETFEMPEAPVLPGDRPAPEAAQSGGGRRRAILLTAVAVVLALGTFTAYRFVANTSQEGDNVASAAPETTTVADAAPTFSDVEAAPAPSSDFADFQSDPGNAFGASEDTAETAPAVANAEPPPAPTEPATVAEAATPAPAAQPRAVAQPRNVQAASAAGGPEAEVAFAPPAGVSGGFDTKPADNPATFTQTPAASANQDAASNLIASLPPEGVGTVALRSAAASGNPAAEFLVGVRYTEGQGVPADLAEAATWYQKAANKGLPPAQYRLASLYEKGRGVERDVSKAKAWYSQAAQAGNAKAMHNLAVLYAEGGGAEPDYAKAAMWFEAAANYGVKDSLFNLGILYAGGIGVDKDLVASYKWFAIAADKGDPEAAKRRDDVANMMDQQTLANARLAVEGFTLEEPDPAANKVTLEPDWAEEASLPASNVSVAPPPDNTAMIREAQDKLNYLGFDTGTPDGQMGPRTRSAIRAFQRSIGIPETGEVDGKLIEELKSQAI
ncbi:peptidoglycan-binding protein [Roseibium sp. MMSF_3544]|uniref:peptidoglycan-binding protein n=1 Tax=unclassified Roseibium TaxID=2629323 RepID=UPI00273E1050|nr:peptidoglycan-binding protein [Roseibium sp. MMSF_3544]